MVAVLAPTPCGPLATIADDREYTIEAVPFWRLNLLEQVRKTYEEIDELADEFVTAGWLAPPLVAVLTPARARNYLAYVNKVFGSNHQIEDLVPLSRRPVLRYAILIAGHRRTLANRHLWTHGCTACREEHGNEDAGVCYARHSRLKSDLIEAKVYRQISPFDALVKQCSENVHRRPPSHEVADGINRLFVLNKTEEPELTVAEFARRSKLNADTIRRARLYCQLPEGLRRDVETGRFAFGAALELARFADHYGLDADAVVIWKEQIVTERVSVSRINRLVAEMISKVDNGHGALFGLEAELKGQKGERRRAFEEELDKAWRITMSYFRRAEPLLASGEMGPGKKYRHQGPLRKFREAIWVLKLVLPLFKRWLSELEAEEARELLEDADATVGRLIEFVPEEPEGLFAAVAGD